MLRLMRVSSRGIAGAHRVQGACGRRTAAAAVRVQRPEVDTPNPLTAYSIATGSAAFRDAPQRLGTRA